MPCCKLVILGEAKVGKTNLLNLLTGEKFVSTHEKTEGVDILLVTTFDIDTKTWKKSTGKGDDEYRRIAATEMASQFQLSDAKPSDKMSTSPTPESLQQAFYSIMKKYTQPSVYSKPKPHTTYPTATTIKRNDDHAQALKLQFSEPQAKFDKRTPVGPSAKSVEKKDDVHSTNLPPARMHSHVAPVSVVAYDADVSVPQTPLPMQVIDTDTSEPIPSGSKDASSSGDQIYTIIFHEATRQKSSEPITVHLKLTSFDFAGQDHYKSMHPCFMTFRAIYIVTFNARDLLSKAKQCVGEINYWVNSILVHCNKGARIILVGTHRGPYSGADGFESLSEEQKRSINEILKKHLKNRPVFKFFKGDRIMALVESSIENNEDASGAQVVREKLLSLGKTHPGNKYELPLSYLRLEAKIFEERSKRSENKLFLIPRDEVEGWVNDFGIEDINVALNFFHDIGIIINPSK